MYENGEFNILTSSQNPSFSPLAEEWLQQLKDTMTKRNGYILCLKKPLYDIADMNEMYSPLRDLNSLQLSDEGKLCLLIQTIQHGKNSERREAIEKLDYVSPFSQHECKEKIKSWILSTVKSMRESLISQYYLELQQGSASKLGVLFHQTEDMYEAAGIVLGQYRGRMEFAKFIQALEKPNCPLVKEKLKLLLMNGEFQGITLFRDADVSINAQWKPGKRTKAKIWRANFDVLGVEEGVELFGEEERSHFEKLVVTLKVERERGINVII
ncbi:hypothetical protein C9374_005626 [Naegleria lovaniensis]|uniref:Uncharacterized protein n=1 Tax=Naegleria lovaniensis TaxID=51637 RepID=A0AA88GK38_NAELO|nr:uncharacterized protein C9374_005626 [Naegleria lovaniensis]KAG2382424.1 hypothetical protein C9374_005626 [Naegleria lovaniensis]